MREHTSTNTQMLTYSALFVALTAVCSWISIPIPGTSVPINLATFAVLLAGFVLGRRYGVMAITAFLILGAVGLPVFHSFTGGLGIIIGPTGGYLIGYLALAFIAGYHKDLKVPFIVAAVLGEVVLYAFGTCWFVYQSGTPFAAALAACVIPFIPGDIAKIALAWFTKKRLERIL